MSESFDAKWQQAYQEAVLETDKKKLTEKVHLAEARIFERLQEIAGENSQEERTALQAAISGLKTLKTDILNYPDWTP